MGRTASVKIDSPVARRRLKVRGKPYCLSIEPRRMLGYVRVAEGAGRWLAIVEQGGSMVGVAANCESSESRLKPYRPETSMLAEGAA
jgi:hypothetical protein